MPTPPFDSLRPLIRYVDEDQAVIDAHFSTHPCLPGDAPADNANPTVDVLVEIDGRDGFHDEGHTQVTLKDHHAPVRFEIVQPQRWWPAGMGEQPLYELSLSLIDRDDVADRKSATLGFTSVRCCGQASSNTQATPANDAMPSLLVNGQVCHFDQVLTVDLVNEHQLLPATGQSLLVVRDHYGPELLYEAADRAGILLIQCVPLDPLGAPQQALAEQVDRLTAHPSLAGWFVGHLGEASQAVSQRIEQLDPTHTVFSNFPGESAA